MPRAVLHKVSFTIGQPLGQADLQSDVPPGRGISWSRSGTNLGPVGLSSDIPPTRDIKWPRQVLS